MNHISSNESGVEIELGLVDTIKGLLLVHPIFLLGIAIILITMIIIFKKDRTTSKIKTSILSLILYYYLCLVLGNIVGIPTLNEFRRLTRLGESFFNPNINLIPFSDGFSLSFILNIFLFIPLGFLCPFISKTFERAKNTLLIGLGLSLFIEFIQLFTLYRATDINDLLTNIMGTIIGYFCFKVVSKLSKGKQHSISDSKKKDYTKYIPTIIIITAFVLGFFS